MNEEAMRVIREFSELPHTDEKMEINNRYLRDEISSFEFFCEASSYLDRVNAIAQGKGE